MRSARAVTVLSAAARLVAAIAAAALLARGLAPFVARPSPVGASSGEVGPTHVALLMLGGVLALAAVSGRRMAAAYRATAIIALNGILLLAVLELAAARAVREDAPEGLLAPRDLFGRGRDSIALDSLARDTLPIETRLPYYREQEWAAQYWRELRALRADYRPYALWRRAPFQGRTITVSGDGYRATPGSDCRSGAYTVFVLGGSTVWGYGVPDWATLPAYIARELRARRGTPVCVMNLGELGYNSTQDLIELVRQLQTGRVPDLVILYQGINDVWTAAQTGRPGLHFFLREIAGRLEGGAEHGAGASWLARSSLFRFVARHAWHRGASAGEQLPAHTSAERMALDTLGAQVVRLYLQNCAMVDALAREYGFAYALFWQPSLITGGKPMGADERRFRQRGMAEGSDFVALMGRSYARVAEEASRHPHLHYMARAFERDSTVLYSDWAHLNPEGNRRAARFIVAALHDALSAPPLAASRARRAGVGSRAAGQ